ncbi:hypothetical protein JCM11641_002283 [Rhodosporidiobolus odoratus]
MPIPSLPLEIVSLVVEDAMADYNPEDRMVRVHSALSIATVCKAWRPIGLGKAWHDLSLHLDDEHDLRFKKLWQSSVFEQVAPYIRALKLRGGLQAKLLAVARRIVEAATSLDEVALDGQDVFSAFFLTALREPSGLVDRLRVVSWSACSNEAVSLNSLLVVTSRLPSLEVLTIDIIADPIVFDPTTLPVVDDSTTLPRLKSLTICLTPFCPMPPLDVDAPFPDPPHLPLQAMSDFLDHFPSHCDVSRLTFFSTRGIPAVPVVERLVRFKLSELRHLDLDSVSPFRPPPSVAQAAPSSKGSFAVQLATLLPTLPRLLSLRVNCSVPTLRPMFKSSDVATVLKALPAATQTVSLACELDVNKGDVLRKFFDSRLDSPLEAVGFYREQQESEQRPGEGRLRWMIYHKRVWEDKVDFYDLEELLRLNTLQLQELEDML